MAENKVNCFASIYIGTAEISMKVFELSQKKRVRKVDDLKKRSALGHETFAKERVSAEALEELCACLMEFLQILEGYRATAYAAYAGPFFSDADNAAFVLEQVRIRTGIRTRSCCARSRRSATRSARSPARAAGRSAPAAW